MRCQSLSIPPENSWMTGERCDSEWASRFCRDLIIALRVIVSTVRCLLGEMTFHLHEPPPSLAAKSTRSNCIVYDLILLVKQSASQSFAIRQLFETTKLSWDCLINESHVSLLSSSGITVDLPYSIRAATLRTPEIPLIRIEQLQWRQHKPKPM